MRSDEVARPLRKVVFFDNEYTGLRASTTIVSIGMVTLEGSQLAVSFDDYDATQVNDWLRANVLSLIDDSTRMTSAQGLVKITQFLEAYSGGEPITLVSAGKTLDLVLLFELWRAVSTKGQLFHWHDHLPAYLQHRAHLDLDTLFIAAGIDPDIDRDSYTGHVIQGTRHEAMYDALVVRECFLKMVRAGLLPALRFND